MNNYRKPHCIGDCDFKSYYVNQAGSGFNNVSLYRGTPFQRGYGFSSFISKYEIPVVKFLGRHLFNVGKEIVND